MAYGIFRSDNMYGTTNPTGLVNIRYSPSSTDTIIENGNVVLLGALDTTERDVYVAGTPARDSAFDMVAIVAEPEVLADERLKDLSDFRNAAGAVCRAYKPHKGDSFGVTTDCLTNATGTTMAIGNVVELQAGTKFKVVTSLTSGSTQIGKIVAIESPYYVVLVQ